MDLPFDGAISAYARDGAPKDIRKTLEKAGKDDILTESYPYRAEMKGKDLLVMKIGFSHDIQHKIPSGVDVKVSGAKQDVITVTGLEKQKTGQVAADIRAYRPPEPYQGKGVRYKGEFIRR